MQLLSRTFRQTRRFWGSWCIALLTVALVRAAQETVMLADAGEAPVLARTVVRQLIEWLSCLPFLPMIFTLAEQIPLSTLPRWRVVITYAAMGGTLVVGNSVLSASAKILLPWQVAPFTALLWRDLRYLFAADLVLFAVCVAVHNAVLYYRVAQERRVTAANLSEQLARAQLYALTLQLQPHFLFNTLHMIAGLVHAEPDHAMQMITCLSDLLRLALRRDRVPLVSLDAELAFLEHYLDIQRTRFRDRLRVTVDAPMETRSVEVPVLLLQPLLENVVHHAVALQSAPVHVELLATILKRQDTRDTLVITIRDDGPGLLADPQGEGIGLSNTRERLTRLYGDASGLTLSNRDGGGAEVQVHLPVMGLRPDRGTGEATDESPAFGSRGVERETPMVPISRKAMHVSSPARQNESRPTAWTSPSLTA